MFGVNSIYSIINPPQSLILGVGKSEKKIVFDEHAKDPEKPYKVANMLTLVSSADHRVVDGALASQWLSRVKKYLEEPSYMLLWSMENIQFVSIIMKKNTSQIFETLVFGSANKLKEFYSANNKEELHRLNEALSTNYVMVESEKSMKELDANKFFYIFELMFETKNIQLVDEALRCIHVSLYNKSGSYCLKVP